MNSIVSDLTSLTERVTTLESLEGFDSARIITIEGNITTINGQLTTILGDIATINTNVAANTTAIAGLGTEINGTGGINDQIFSINDQISGTGGINDQIATINSRLSTLETNLQWFKGYLVIGNADLKAATQMTIVSPDPAKYWIPYFWAIEMVYGGHNAFTNAPVFSLFTPTSGGDHVWSSMSYLFNGTANASEWLNVALPWQQISFEIFVNEPLKIKMSTGATGNPANDNYVRVFVYYGNAF